MTVAAATLAASLILAYSKSDLRAVEGSEEVAGIAVAQSFGAVDASVAAATVALVGLGGAVVWLIEKLREARVRARHLESEVKAALGEPTLGAPVQDARSAGHSIAAALTTVSSLLALQALRARSDETRRALDAAQMRVHAVAAVHRRSTLAGRSDVARADEFLESVIDEILRAHGYPKRARVEVAAAPLQMSLRDATAVGLIVSELVTNSLEHAFPAERAGLIRVLLSAEADGVPVLTVTDDGVGLPESLDQDAEGLGCVIVRQLSAPFGAQPKYSRPEDGGLNVQMKLETLRQPVSRTAEEN